MNNQESQNQDKTTEAANVNKRRRFIKGAGVVTPVILTLSSPSVFGIQCGSEIASGNVSNVGTGSCTSGKSPVYWKDITSWPGTTYIKSSLFKVVFVSGDSDATTLQERLVAGTANSSTTTQQATASLIAALLNAAQANTYPLTEADVKAIQAGTLGVPTKPTIKPAIDTDIIAYLSSTW